MKRFLIKQVLLILGVAFFLTKIHLPNFDHKILIALIFYFFAHVLRAVRMWICFSDFKEKLSNVFLANIFADTVGAFVFKPIGEFFRLITLSIFTKQKPAKVVLAVFLTRFFDLLFFILVVLLTSTQSMFQFSSSAKLIFFLSTIILVVFLIFLPQMSILVKQSIIKNIHSKTSIVVVKLISEIQINYKSMHLERLINHILLFLLTGIIWIIDYWVLKLSVQYFYPDKSSTSIFDILSLTTGITAIPKVIPQTLFFPFVIVLLFSVFHNFFNARHKRSYL